jgi:uncharacterized protein (TIGR03643 family)
MQEQLYTFTDAQVTQIKKDIWDNKISIGTIASQYGVDENTIASAISNQPSSDNKKDTLTDLDIDRIIEMGWEDRTPFDAIEKQFGISEAQVIMLMRQHMKPSSFKMWRKRVTNRITKHSAKHAGVGTRFKCSLQKTITHNKISKR